MPEAPLIHAPTALEPALTAPDNTVARNSHALAGPAVSQLCTNVEGEKLSACRTCPLVSIDNDAWASVGENVVPLAVRSCRSIALAGAAEAPRKSSSPIGGAIGTAAFAAVFGT